MNYNFTVTVNKKGELWMFLLPVSSPWMTALNAVMFLTLKWCATLVALPIQLSIPAICFFHVLVPFRKSQFRRIPWSLQRCRWWIQGQAALGFEFEVFLVLFCFLTFPLRKQNIVSLKTKLFPLLILINLNKFSYEFLIHFRVWLKNSVVVHV